MAYYQNEMKVRGYISFVEVKQFQQSQDFSYHFNVALSMGKDKQTGQNRPSEFFKVQVSANASKSNHGRIGNGDFVQLEGRLRARTYQDNQGQKQTYHYIEAFDLFLINKAKPKLDQQVPQQGYQQAPQQAPQQPMQAYGSQNNASTVQNFQPMPNQGNGAHHPNEQQAPMQPNQQSFNPNEADIPF